MRSEQEITVDRAISALARVAALLLSLSLLTVGVQAAEPGDVLWTRQLPPRAYYESRSDATYAADGTFRVAGDDFVQKCDSVGNVLWEWERPLTGLGGADIRGVCALSDGSCIITGDFWDEVTFGPGMTFVAPEFLWHGFLVRLSPEGTLVWAQATEGESACTPRAIEAYPDDSFVVTGRFFGEMVLAPGTDEETTLVSRGHPCDGCQHGERPNLFVARFAGDGTLQWARQEGGPGWPGTWAIAATADGGCLIPGSTSRDDVVFGQEPQDATTVTLPAGVAFVAKCSGEGALQWIRGSTGTCGAGLLSLFSDGGFVTAGTFRGTVHFGTANSDDTTLSCPEDLYGSAYIARFSPDGEALWARYACTEAAERFDIQALADGSILLSGSVQDVAAIAPGSPEEVTHDAEDRHDLFLAHFMADGTLDWVRWGTPGAGQKAKVDALAVWPGAPDRCLVILLSPTLTLNAGAPDQRVLEGGRYAVQYMTHVAEPPPCCHPAAAPSRPGASLPTFLIAMATLLAAHVYRQMVRRRRSVGR